MIKKEYRKLGRKRLRPGTSTGVHLPPVEHTGAQVDTVAVMTMIVLRAAMAVDTITEMEMGGKENMDTGTMTDMVVLEIHPIGKEIVIPEIPMNAMVEIIEKMSTKEVRATMNMLKELAAGAMVGKGIHMGMMKLIHPVAVAATPMRLPRMRGL
jgi:hypothetical protein